MKEREAEKGFLGATLGEGWGTLSAKLGSVRRSSAGAEGGVRSGQVG